MLRSIEHGDQAAVETFVRCYEAEIRRAIRVRLTDPRLRRVLDSADVCQSVFANFFVRVALGEYDLNHPADIAALLIAMARNKLLDQVRHLHARKRDQRRVAADDAGLAVTMAPQESPSQIVAGRDLAAEVRKRLTDDERQLADLRGAGLEWPEIAAQLHAQPDALRKKLTRALDRIAAELGLSEFRT